MKKLLLPILTALLIANTGFSQNETVLKLIPDDCSALFIFSNYEDDFGFLSSVMSPGQLQAFNAMVGVLDDSQLGFGGFMGTDISADMPDEEIESRLFIIVPIETDEETAISTFGKVFEGEVVQYDDDIYAIQNSYMTFLESDGETYLLLTPSPDGINRYKESDMMKSNSTEISEFLNDYSEMSGAVYIDGNILKTLKEIDNPALDGLSGFMTDAVSALIEKYEMIDEIDYFLGYVDQLSRPVTVALRVFSKSGSINNQIYLEERNESYAYLPEGIAAYVELNIRPEFVVDVLWTLGYAQQSGINTQQIQEIQNALTGTICAAIYNIQTGYGQGSAPTSFIGIVGLEDSDWVDTMLRMMVPYVSVNIQGETVYKIQTENPQLPYMYVLITETDLIISSVEKQMSAYIGNMLQGYENFGDEIAQTDGVSQVFTIYVPHSNLMDQLTQSLAMGMTVDIESINVHMDIQENGESIDFIIEIN